MLPRLRVLGGIGFITIAAIATAASYASAGGFIGSLRSLVDLHHRKR